MDDNFSPLRGTAPTRAELIQAIRSFPLKQKLLFLALALLCLGSVLGIVWSINNHYMVTVVAPGGTITEGIIGSPHLINPLLAASDPDRDLTMLLYSGLMRADGSGRLIPDLAESYTVTPDGTQYIFTLRPNLKWSDGEPLTTDDVIYTLSKAQDPAVKSIKRASWEGVRIEKINDRQIRFTLKQPFASFLENTTLGILPKHAWNEVTDAEISLNILNTEPIGSGPYVIKSIKKGNDNIPQSYSLKPNPNFALSEPNITSLIVRFYANENDRIEAYRNHEIDNINAVNAAIAVDINKHLSQNILCQYCKLK